MFNGGMEAVSPVWWGMCLGLTAAIDLYGVDKSRSGDPAYFPGNLGFDPLGLYPSETGGRKRMELAEIKHGRTAMLTVAGYAAQEYVTGLGVVEETRLFFFPIAS
jgi:Chlorophyll A-B binding protein